MKPYWRQNTNGMFLFAAYSCYYDYENITGDSADPFIYYFYLMEFL